MTPCEIVEFLRNNIRFLYLVNDPYFISNMAIDLGLPYCDNMSIVKLCEFSKLKKRHLLVEASELGDIR